MSFGEILKKTPNILKSKNPFLPARLNPKNMGGYRKNFGMPAALDSLVVTHGIIGIR